MDQTIVVCTKTSSVALHQNHAIEFIKILESKYQILNLNFILPKSNAQEPTINNFYEINNREFEYALKIQINRRQPQ